MNYNYISYEIDFTNGVGFIQIANPPVSAVMINNQMPGVLTNLEDKFKKISAVARYIPIRSRQPSDLTQIIIERLLEPPLLINIKKLFGQPPKTARWAHFYRFRDLDFLVLTEKQDEFLLPHNANNWTLLWGISPE